MPPKTSESLINKLSGKPANMAHGPYHTAYHLPRLSEMRLLFFEKVFNSIGFALVSIFIPIYLLQLNYSIQAVIVYHLAMGLWMLLLIPLSLKLITRIGPNRTMVIGNLGSIVLFILLFTLPSQHWSLWLLAFWRAVASAAYFPAFHANFITAAPMSGQVPSWD